MRHVARATPACVIWENFQGDSWDSHPILGGGGSGDHPERRRFFILTGGCQASSAFEAARETPAKRVPELRLSFCHKVASTWSSTNRDLLSQFPDTWKVSTKRLSSTEVIHVVSRLIILRVSFVHGAHIFVLLSVRFPSYLSLSFLSFFYPLLLCEVIK